MCVCVSQYFSVNILSYYLPFLMLCASLSLSCSFPPLSLSNSMCIIKKLRQSFYIKKLKRKRKRSIPAWERFSFCFFFVCCRSFWDLCGRGRYIKLQPGGYIITVFLLYGCVVLNTHNIKQKKKTFYRKSIFFSLVVRFAEITRGNVFISRLQRILCRIFYTQWYYTIYATMRLSFPLI